MTDLGKIDRETFDRHVAGRVGADRADVALGPRHGIDFGAIEVGDRAVVVATDPVSIVPDLGLERATRFALDVVLADVAVSGLAPSHLSIAFSLPPETTDAAFATVQSTIDEECADLGVAVVAGHTARYAGCSYPWVGAATALGVGDPDRIVRPDGARPGDRLLVTTGPAVEAAGLLATLFGERIDLPESTLDDAREAFADAYAVRDALTAAAAGPVTAMHDVTEGGLAAATTEMAAGAGVRFEIDREAVPTRAGVAEVCSHLGFDPWHATSCGTLVIAVDPDGVDDVRRALAGRGTAVAEVGTVEAAEGSGAGPGVVVDGDRLEPPARDPSWAVYADLAESTNRE